MSAAEGRQALRVRLEGPASTVKPAGCTWARQQVVCKAGQAALQALSLTKTYEEEDEADDKAEEEAEQRDRAAASRAQAAAQPKPLDQASPWHAGDCHMCQDPNGVIRNACSRPMTIWLQLPYSLCSLGFLSQANQPSHPRSDAIMSVCGLQGGGMFFYERVYWGARGFLDRLFSGKASASSPSTAAEGKAALAAPEDQPQPTHQSPHVAGQQAGQQASPAQSFAGSAANPLVQRVPVTAS